MSAQATVQDDDVRIFVVSYPKTGRTWLRFLVSRAIRNEYGLEEACSISLRRATQLANLPLTGITHDGTGIVSDSDQAVTHYTQLCSDKSDYHDKKVIFLVRDPRDVVVSNYFQVTTRQKVIGNMTLPEFIRDGRFGIHKVLRFYSIWDQNRHVPQAFLLVRYEDLHSNAHDIVRQIVSFIGMPHISDASLSEAIEFASPQNMRKIERAGTYNVPQPPDVDNLNSYKTRRAKVGGYVDYLSADDLAFINPLVANQCPFYGAGSQHHGETAQEAD